jgi:hypothetical protein
VSHPSRKSSLETAAPNHNFTISTEERLRALTCGPPAAIRRLRAIEDLESAIVRTLAERYAEARRLGMDGEEHARAHAPVRAIERLNELIRRHNRWYPIEANLPIHPPTGELLDRTGMPWTPRPRRSMDDLLACARLAVRPAG